MTHMQKQMSKVICIIVPYLNAVGCGLLIRPYPAPPLPTPRHRGTGQRGPCSDRGRHLQWPRPAYSAPARCPGLPGTGWIEPRRPFVVALYIWLAKPN